MIFENDENFTVDYLFYLVDDYNPSGLSKYYMKKVKYNIINNLQIPSLESVQEEYKYKNNLNNKKQRKLDDVNWDYSNIGDNIKCKVDHENKKNVLYQNSFSPSDTQDFQNA